MHAITQARILPIAIARPSQLQQMNQVREVNDRFLNNQFLKYFSHGTHSASIS